MSAIIPTQNSDHLRYPIARQDTLSGDIPSTAPFTPLSPSYCETVKEHSFAGYAPSFVLETFNTSDRQMLIATLQTLVNENTKFNSLFTQATAALEELKQFRRDQAKSCQHFQEDNVFDEIETLEHEINRLNDETGHMKFQSQQLRKELSLENATTETSDGASHESDDGLAQVVTPGYMPVTFTLETPSNPETPSLFIPKIFLSDDADIETVKTHIRDCVNTNYTASQALKKIELEIEYLHKQPIEPLQPTQVDFTPLFKKRDDLKSECEEAFLKNRAAWQQWGELRMLHNQSGVSNASDHGCNIL